MKIGIDARFFSESGVGRYLRNLISNLEILDKENQYFIFLLQKDYKHFINTKNFQGIVADYGWYGFAEQFNLPKLLNKFQLDLVHFPHFNVPVFYSGKFLVTIHDLIHQHFQMKRATTLGPITYEFKQLGYKRVFKNAIQKAQKILTPSEYVKKLLKKEWRVDNKKVIVTHESVDENMLTILSKIKQKEVNQVIEKFNIKPPYIFYVGNAHPHKNVEGLIEAFIILRKHYQYLTLVLSGNDHYFWQRIKREFQYKDIIFTGYISEEELVALYKSAQVFVLPSYEEGFGIPILEAMVCGTPVISSNAGSLKEVGGNAAVYFDPADNAGMVDQIDQVLKSQKLRRDLIMKGKKRILEFSWERLANKTLETYLQCV